MADYRKGPISSNLEDKTGEPPAYPSWYMDFIINPLDHMLNRTIGTAARRDANAKWNTMAPNEQSKFINDGLNSLSNLTTNPSVHETTRAPDELSKLYADWMPSAGTFRGHTFNALMQPNAVDDRPLAFRSTLAPFGTYANPDGSESVGFAWPAAVTEPINALQRLAQNSYTEDGRLGIPDPRHPENLSDMETLLWTGFGSNALKGTAGAALRPLQQPTILEQYHAANNLPHPGYGYLQEPVASTAEDALRWVRESGPIIDGELLSDTGKPSLMGSAVAGAQGNGISISGAHPNYQIMRDGSQVGRAYVREYPDTIQLGQLHVDPEVQRQGIATEAQRLLAQQYGKPTVPDVNLSESELARWMKNDPAAVSDYEPYFPGASSFSPKYGTEGYYASQGSGVMPGSRAASGELFSDTGKPSLMGAAVAGENARPGITAYHGSPHDFDKFSLDKIGTGEGAQAYGYGLYFAENEGVARSYRNALSDVTTQINGIDVDGFGKTGAPNQALRYVAKHKGDIDSALRHLRSYPRDKYRREAAKWLADNRKAVSAKVNGRMYEVNIKANPDDFLDWDKPLSQQSEAVRTKLGVPTPEKIAEAERLAKEIDRMNRRIDGDGFGGPHPDEAMRIKDDLVRQYLEIDPTESAWWKFDAKDSVARPEAAAKMREAGIPGIRYLDGNSRGTGEGSRNYVVFDDSLIEILKKYGLAGGAIGASSLFDFNTENQF